MPNHVKIKMKASKHVISSLIKDDRVDFNTVIPSFDDGQEGRVSGIVECLAESCLPFDRTEFLAGLKQSRMLESDITKLDDNEFKKFIAMLDNKRTYGYLHCLDFNREEWGTKWNAYDCDIESEQVVFHTAWNIPMPVLLKLSSKFPEEIIKVEYADEDIGSNCGAMTVKGGEITDSDIAPNYNDQSDSEKLKWNKFAFRLQYGDKADPKDFYMNDNYEYMEE